MEFILTNKAPLPLGHYSQGTIHNGVIYVAGQLPLFPENPDKMPETMAEQVTLALENMLAVVVAGGGNKNSILKVNI